MEQKEILFLILKQLMIKKYIGNGTEYKKNIPTKDVSRWPKKIFFGCENGLSG